MLRQSRGGDITGSPSPAVAGSPRPVVHDLPAGLPVLAVLVHRRLRRSRLTAPSAPPSDPVVTRVTESARMIVASQVWRDAHTPPPSSPARAARPVRPGRCGPA